MYRFIALATIACSFFVTTSHAESVEQTFTCPDGRQIATTEKSSIEQRANTAELKINEIKTTYSDLPGWNASQDAESLLQVIRNNCSTRKLPKGWREACSDMKSLQSDAIHQYIENNFVPYRLSVNEQNTGKVTGYYASYVNVSATKSDKYRFPLYKVSSAAKKLARAHIEAGAIPETDVLYWADNAFDAYLLAIQGSGVGKLPDGTKVKILYAGKNNHGYVSIGKVLKECGTITESVTLPVIRRWIDNASETEYAHLIGNNQSYVFFRHEDYDNEGPKGSLGVPLTAMRSIAVDRRYFTLGSMMYLSLAHPLTSDERIERIMLAQDTGGAINGGLRADIFIGEGEEADKIAGRLAHEGSFWILKPKATEK